MDKSFHSSSRHLQQTGMSIISGANNQATTFGGAVNRTSFKNTERPAGQTPLQATANQFMTTNGEYQDKFLITELGQQPLQGTNRSYAALDRPQTDESMRGNSDNQIFNVQDAEPPTDFDAPYSKLPSNVVLKRVKTNVSQSLTFRNKSHADEWAKIFELEHANAIISDSFWYVICKVFKKDKKYDPYKEFLLDRIAANYVSFTIVEDVKLDPQVRSKFFESIYDIIAQSVFYSLFYAFPKSRSLLNNEMKRKLLNIFSYLFTGMKIKSAKFEHWTLDMGTGNILQGPKKQGGVNGRDPISLADIDRQKLKKLRKSNRERVHMKYSPLVERYLLTHKYETMNNVREWKMLLTQRTEIQKEIDSKFEKYMKIAKKSKEDMMHLSSEYDNQCKVIDMKIKENEKAAAKHIETLKQSKKEKLENGGYSEYANMLVSIFNSEHVNNIDGGN